MRIATCKSQVSDTTAPSPDQRAAQLRHRRALRIELERHAYAADLRLDLHHRRREQAGAGARLRRDRRGPELDEPSPAEVDDEDALVPLTLRPADLGEAGRACGAPWRARAPPAARRASAADRRSRSGTPAASGIRGRPEGRTMLSWTSASVGDLDQGVTAPAPQSPIGSTQRLGTAVVGRPRGPDRRESRARAASGRSRGACCPRKLEICRGCRGLRNRAPEPLPLPRSTSASPSLSCHRPAKNRRCRRGSCPAK